jgi:thiol-disulfide isomerase/thioredoxin
MNTFTVIQSLLLLGLSINQAHVTSAFSVATLTSSSIARLQQSSTSLHLLAAPMEEKEKEDTDKDNHDWTPTRGGFLPNLRNNNNSINNAMIQVTTLHDYKHVVVDERDHFVVVQFYAPWCRSCKAVAPQVNQLRRALKERVKFVQVPVIPETILIHQGLGVPSVPFAHIYHPDVGLVEEMKMSKKHFDEFSKVLHHYVKGECDIPLEQEEAEFE